MLPDDNSMMFCIMQDGQIADGQGGLAIGATEAEAWERLNGGEGWAIDRAKRDGAKVRRCAIMVVNP